MSRRATARCSAPRTAARPGARRRCRRAFSTSTRCPAVSRDEGGRACSGRPWPYGVAMGLAESPLAANLALVRNDWTRDEVRALFRLPFPELVYEAARVHRLHFDPTEVQISTLLSIKTGGCPEDCAYCPQSAKYDTGVKAEKLMDLGAV